MADDGNFINILLKEDVRNDYGDNKEESQKNIEIGRSFSDFSINES